MKGFGALAFLACAASVRACGEFSGYDNELIIDPSLTARWSVIDDNGVQSLSAALVFTGAGWSGWGFSTDGKMIGSEAVVNQPGVTATPESFDLTAKSTAGVIAQTPQTITTSAYTASTTGGGTFTFVRPLVAGTHTLLLDTPQWHLFAYSNTSPSLVHHDVRYPIELTLTLCEGTTVTPPVSTSVEDTFAPTTDAPTISPSLPPTQF